MFTIAETRRARLEELIEQKGSLANLNEALGYARNDTRLARIRNANARTDRPGKVFQMGALQAREIEEQLKLQRGWMDIPPGAASLPADEAIRALHRVAETLQPYQVQQLIEIGATLARSPLPFADTQPKAGEMRDTDSAAPVAGLVVMDNIAAKKIGKGHFGPPATEPPAGGKRGSSKDRASSRKRHAGGDR